MSGDKNLSLSVKMLCAGSAACTADIVSYPLDVTKVRLQIATFAPSTSTSVYRGLFGTMYGMVQHEGLGSLYRGISPALQRQCVFASIRIGLYEPVKAFYEQNIPFDSASTGGGGGNATYTMFIRIISAITTGAIGISFAQPTDMVKVRMQANAGRYRSSLQAYRTIYNSERIRGLWRGLGPNIVRNSLVNAAELVCYDTVKETILEKNIMRDHFGCHFTSAFAAGFVATFVSSPIDVIKTNYMNSCGQFEGVWHCAKTIASNGGMKAFYKGFFPSFMRLGTWNVCMFVTFEQLKCLAARTTTTNDTSGLLPSLPSRKAIL